MKTIKLVIEVNEEKYRQLKFYIEQSAFVEYFYNAIANGIPLEEIPNPCIECSQNCCVCELNGEKCECQKVYVVKEKNNGT